MAAFVQIGGPTQIFVGTGAGNALQFLGYTVNGAEITAENVMEDVPGDQGGGDGAIPIEIQVFGQLHRLHLEFSKWDINVFNLLTAAINQNGVGSISAGFSAIPGTLFFANNAAFRLLVKPPLTAQLIRNYQLAIPREPNVYNVGTKWSRLVMDWVAYPDLNQSPPKLYDFNVN